MMGCRLVDWYRGYGATTPSHLGRKLAGPLCTAFSSARQPQRCSVSSDMRALRQRGTEMGEKMADKFRLKTRLPRNFQGSLTCRKSATLDRRLYFPSEGWRAEDFLARKILRLRPEASTLTTRPPKPLNRNSMKQWQSDMNRGNRNNMKQWQTDMKSATEVLVLRKKTLSQLKFVHHVSNN